MMVSDTTDAPTELTHMTQISQTSIQRAPIMMTWRNRAACLCENPELFFPIGNTGPALLQSEEVKAVCRRCEVMETCLEWAIESGQDAGVWGGMSEDERMHSNDAMPAPAAPAESQAEQHAPSLELAGLDQSQATRDSHSLGSASLSGIVCSQRDSPMPASSVSRTPRLDALQRPLCVAAMTRMPRGVTATSWGRSH